MPTDSDYNLKCVQWYHTCFKVEFHKIWNSNEYLWILNTTE